MPQIWVLFPTTRSAFAEKVSDFTALFEVRTSSESFECGEAAQCSCFGLPMLGAEKYGNSFAVWYSLKKSALKYQYLKEPYLPYSAHFVQTLVVPALVTVWHS